MGTINWKVIGSRASSAPSWPIHPSNSGFQLTVRVHARQVLRRGVGPNWLVAVEKHRSLNIYASQTKTAKSAGPPAGSAETWTWPVQSRAAQTTRHAAPEEVKLQEEKLRALNLIVWLVVALALVVAGLLVVLSALAICLWGIAGYFGLVGLALATLAAGAGVLWAIRGRIRNDPTPFAETIGEFKKDRECLRNDN